MGSIDDVLNIMVDGGYISLQNSTKNTQQYQPNVNDADPQKLSKEFQELLVSVTISLLKTPQQSMTISFFRILIRNHNLFIISTWQPLGPLLKVKLLVGYIYPLVVRVAQWLIGELVSDQHNLSGLHIKSHDQLKGAKGMRLI